MVSPHPDFGRLLPGLIEKYVRLWRDTPPVFPSLCATFSLAEQRAREREIDEFLARVGPISRPDRRRPRRREVVTSSVSAFVVATLDAEHRPPAADFIAACSCTAETFVRRARKFDRFLPPEKVHQALRNLWVVNALQAFFGKEVLMTPSAFAYSMLYPYTDNFLDDPSIARGAKQRFQLWLEGRLEGAGAGTSNIRERRISRLVGMIEEEYCREEYPGVYQSLLAIHRAQTGSLFQQDDVPRPPQSDLLEITIRKGGASVLADGYLADGKLCAREAGFAFGLGASLQMIDDLQDLADDRASGQESFLSTEARQDSLDNATNRVLGFVAAVIGEGGGDEFPARQALHALTLRCCIALILESVARHAPLYSREYLDRMEMHSQVRFAHLRRLRGRMEKARSGTPGVSVRRSAGVRSESAGGR